MPRFGLREFSTPEYRGSLPERDPNNAIWPRISAFAKMLHDISWKDKETRPPDQDELDAIAASESEMMNGYTPAAEAASKQMEGYKPSTPEQDVEAMVDEQQRRVNGNYTGGHRDDSVDMDRQRQLAEAAMREDPDTVARHQSELLDELNYVNANAKKRTPSEDGNGYYQMGPEYVKHYHEIVGTPADGDWGKASKKALENYLKQRGY